MHKKIQLLLTSLQRHSLSPRSWQACISYQQKLPDWCARDGDAFAIFKTGGTFSLMSQWEYTDWAALLWMLHVKSLFVLCKGKYLFLDKPRQPFPLPFLFSTLDFQSSQFWNILFPVPRETRWRAVLPDKKLAVFLHYRVALFSLCYIYTRGKKIEKSFPSSKRENNSDHILRNNNFFFYNVVNSSEPGFVLGRCFHNYRAEGDRRWLFKWPN